MSEDFQSGFLPSSAILFNRRILLLDDCEGTFDYLQGGTGGDDTHAYATAAALMGTNGIQVKTRTTDAADGDLTSIYKVLPYPLGNRIVCRINFRVPDISECEAVKVQFSFRDGANAHLASIKVSPNTPKTEYLDADGNWQEITGLDHPMIDQMWAKLEWQVDISALEYISASYNGTLADLSGIAVRTSGASTDRQSRITLEVEATAEAPVTIHYDFIYCGELINL